MSEISARLAERLLSEGQKTVEFFRGLSADQWSQEVYTEGACWNLHQVLAHFYSAEVAMTLLIQNILSGGPGSPEDFDLNAYNERRVEKLREATSAELLDKYWEARQASAALVQAMSAEDLELPGRHPFLGQTTVEEIVKLLYRHNQIHQRDIRHLLTPENGENATA